MRSGSIKLFLSLGNYQLVDVLVNVKQDMLMCTW